MIPDEINKNILEYVVNEEPWHIVCGAFNNNFKNPKELIHRIFRLYDENLITISKGPSTTVEPTPQSFEKEAVENDWFNNSNCTDGAWWDIKATEKGFEYVKDRFK